MILCWRCCQKCCLYGLFLCFLGFVIGLLHFCFFFRCSCSLVFLVAVVLLWFLPSGVRHWLPPSGVSWMVPVDWCFFLLIIQGAARRCGGIVVDGWMTHGTNLRWTNSLWRIWGSRRCIYNYIYIIIFIFNYLWRLKQIVSIWLHVLHGFVLYMNIYLYIYMYRHIYFFAGIERHWKRNQIQTTHTCCREDRAPNVAPNKNYCIRTCMRT